MKSLRHTSTLLTTLLLLAGATLAVPQLAAAASTPQTSIRPVPVEIVQPTGLPSRFKDATVKLALTIDEAGNVRDVAPVGHMQEDLKRKLLPVVAQWKFTPMLENGRPISVRAIFPLTLADKA